MSWVRSLSICVRYRTSSWSWSVESFQGSHDMTSGVQGLDHDWKLLEQFICLFSTATHNTNQLTPVRDKLIWSITVSITSYIWLRTHTSYKENPQSTLKTARIAFSKSKRTGWSIWKEVCGGENQTGGRSTVPEGSKDGDAYSVEGRKEWDLHEWLHCKGMLRKKSILAIMDSFWAFQYQAEDARLIIVKFHTSWSALLALDVLKFG